MITVDAKGLFCPEPLMMAKKALDGSKGEPVLIEVDSAAPRDNILRLAHKEKRTATVQEHEGIFTISLI